MQVDILYNLANTEVMMENHKEAIQKYQLVNQYFEITQPLRDLADPIEIDNIKDQ